MVTQHDGAKGTAAPTPLESPTPCFPPGYGEQRAPQGAMSTPQKMVLVLPGGLAVARAAALQIRTGLILPRAAPTPPHPPEMMSDVSGKQSKGASPAAHIPAPTGLRRHRASLTQGHTACFSRKHNIKRLEHL